MADQKITDFSADASPAAADLVVTAKSPFGAGSNRKVTLANMKALMLATPTITGHATIEGVTATGATGTGNFVFSAAPTFTGTVTAPTLKTTTLFATSDGAGALVINKADGTTNVLTLNTTTQEAKLTQIGANATGYADQRSSGIFNFESSQWNGAAAVAGNWTLQGIAGTAANTNVLTLKYGSNTVMSIGQGALATFFFGQHKIISATATTTFAGGVTPFSLLQNSNTTVDNVASIQNANAGNMYTGALVFRNKSHHATTGSADFELWLANGSAEAKVFGVTAAGVLSVTGDIGATGARITKGWFTDLAATSATLGAASTDVITHTGRCVLRTLGSDPQHVTPGSRPAGTVAEMAFYNGKMYFCTNAATPTWELITSA